MTKKAFINQEKEASFFYGKGLSIDKRINIIFYHLFQTAIDACHIRNRSMVVMLNKAYMEKYDKKKPQGTYFFRIYRIDEVLPLFVKGDIPFVKHDNVYYLASCCVDARSERLRLLAEELVLFALENKYI